MVDISNELGISVTAALIGVISATIVSVTKERQEKSKEINKIRSLLTDDFTSLYKEITKDRQLFQNELDRLGTEGNLINKLISGEVDFSEVYSKYGIFYDLEYWRP